MKEKVMSEPIRKQDATIKSFVRAGAGALLVVALFLAGTINLESTPGLWSDEGWTLSVVRNWVERGHYGRLLDGEPATAHFSAAFPVTAPVALSFRLLGVGVWQGRLVGVFFTLGALTLIYYLARRLYDPSVAKGAIAVLLFMSPHHSLHPILIGRQVLGEMPMLFYLLAGYACFLGALRRPLWFMPLAVGLWAIALNTKAQVLPFWIASLLIPLSVMLFRRRWSMVRPLFIGLLSSLIASRVLLWLEHALLRNQTVPGSPIHGLYDVVALVPTPHVRLIALFVTLTFGLLTLLGLGYATGQYTRNYDKTALTDAPEVVRLALLTLAGSWFAWYVLLSAGWPRYLFPVTFIGSIFVAAMLRDLTDNFNLSSTIKRIGYALRHLSFNRQSIHALLAIVLMALTFFSTLRALHQFYIGSVETSVLQVTDFLHTHTARTAVIETYDPQLFFLLDRRYHYPPDQVRVELLRRVYLHQDVPIDYDPLVGDPDYLVTGRFVRRSQLYDPVLATGAFRLVRVYGHYDIYERVR